MENENTEIKIDETTTMSVDELVKDYKHLKALNDYMYKRLIHTQDYSFDLQEQLNSQNEYIATQESVIKEVEEMLDVLVDTFDENTIKGKSKPELNLVEYLRERREFKQRKNRRIYRRICNQSRQRRKSTRLDRRLRSGKLRHGLRNGRCGARRKRLRFRQETWSGNQTGYQSGEGRRRRFAPLRGVRYSHQQRRV